MPRRRPINQLKRLGTRIRARRLYLGRTRDLVAGGAEISVNQLALYESGQGHPPAFTLSRLARLLGTTTSALLGETEKDDGAGMINELMRIYAHPQVGAVVRYMQDMTPPDRQSLMVVAQAFANRHKALDRIEVMR